MVNIFGSNDYRPVLSKFGKFRPILNSESDYNIAFLDSRENCRIINKSALYVARLRCSFGSLCILGPERPRSCKNPLRKKTTWH